jgi:hypothetical protein
LIPISKGNNPEDYLEFVQFILPEAKELVKAFEDLAAEFGRSAVERQQKSTSSQSPEIDLRRSSALFTTPRPDLGRPANTSPTNVVSSLAPRQNEVAPSSSTQDFQDDGHRDDVQNLLVLSEVNIPPRQRKQTPKQMSCDLTEHQKIGLTWLLEQEKDRKKKGGLLAGMSDIWSRFS